MVKSFKKKKIGDKIKRTFSISAERPRLSISKSNTAIYCQLIDDKKKIIISLSSREINKNKKNCNIEMAKKTGETMGEKILNFGIKTISFDRNGYLYHGKVLAVAEGIRSKGVIF